MSRQRIALVVDVGPEDRCRNAARVLTPDRLSQLVEAGWVVTHAITMDVVIVPADGYIGEPRIGRAGLVIMTDGDAQTPPPEPFGDAA